MKKKCNQTVKMFLLTMILLCGILLLNGCEKKTASMEADFLENSISVEKYETYELKLTGCEEKDIRWKSKDKSIATVKDGVVCANKKGKTTVTAEIDGEKISCEVVVTDSGFVPTITWNESGDVFRVKKGETYQLSPQLTYNGNTYTDVTYSYHTVKGLAEADDAGVISGKELGNDVICVEAKWRDTVIETSVQAAVVDVSTAIEVGDKEFLVYVNGEGEWPASADIGTVVYEKNQIVENPDSVLYVEKAKDGDVEGAAVIRDGRAYAKKTGTTHFVAQYTSKSGKVCKSTEFEVRVEQTPADIYMAAISGKEFEFFFEPLSEDNSVEWDESKQAYHLKNLYQSGNDGRAFVINREYFMNILKYTKAESISFEVMTDGRRSGYQSDDEGIYRGYYPDTWSDGTIVRESLPTKWMTVEFNFKDIPKDADGLYKTIYLMNTVEGMYVRNITLWLPGDDRTGYDPNHNYLSEITGKDYEFFIESLDGANSVKWDSREKAYHLINTVTKQSDTRGFIFNRNYFYNITKHTNAESISFEICTDGKKTGIKTDDQGIYQGFYPDWWDADYVTRHAQSDKWTKVEIFFKDIPKDEEGMIKTIFLMNTTEGTYVRNIRLYCPGDDRTGYDEKVDYSADIKGKDYEFFIEALGSSNSVKWDKKKQAFHLINKEKKQSDTRGFIFNKDYLTNIINHTKAESIVFEVMTDGKSSGCKAEDRSIYQGFYPNWWDQKHVTRYDLSAKWTKIEIFFKDIPKDENGNLKTVFLMNSVEGMYIRNIRLYKAGEDRTTYDATHNYLEPIQGAEYEYFIEPLGQANSVKWDAKQKAYHLINKETRQSDTRGFIFNQDYMTNIINRTKAETISFEFKTDGVQASPDFTDNTIYQGFYPDWYQQGQMTRVTLTTEKWYQAEIAFADIPKAADGSLKSIFLMNAKEGLYVRNIKVNLPVTYETVGSIDLTDPANTWKSAAETGLTGGNGKGTYSAQNGVVKMADCYIYAVHKVCFADTTAVYDDTMKLRLKVKAMPNREGMNNLELRLFAYDTTGGLGSTTNAASIYKFTSQGEWETIEIPMSEMIDQDGHFKGFSFGMFGYGAYTTGELYTVEFDKVEILKRN